MARIWDDVIHGSAPTGHAAEIYAVPLASARTHDLGDRLRPAGA